MILPKTTFAASVLMVSLLVTAAGQSGEIRTLEDTGLTNHELEGCHVHIYTVVQWQVTR